LILRDGIFSFPMKLFFVVVCSLSLVHVSISASSPSLIPFVIVIASTDNGQGEDDYNNEEENTRESDEVDDIREDEGDNGDDNEIDLDEMNLLQICCAWSGKISDGVLEYRIIGEVDDNTKQLVRNAIKDWDLLIDNLVFLENMADDGADVNIDFSDNDEDADGEEYDFEGSVAAGVTRLIFDDEGFIDNVDVTLSGGIFEYQFYDSALEQIARHEIGHVLGLGHANFVDSLMFESTHGGTESISACEINGVLAANHWKLVSGGDNINDGPEYPNANFVVC